jgi:hypothetical protein
MDAYRRADRDYDKAMNDAGWWEEVVDNVEDNLKWAGECLHNFRYSNEHKLQKCKRYLEEAIDTIENELSRRDDCDNIPEDDWREDR